MKTIGQLRPVRNRYALSGSGLHEEGSSRMSYTLEPEGEVVKLTVTHEIDGPGSKLIDGVSQGWPHLLSSLKSLLETSESFVVSRTWPSRPFSTFTLSFTMPFTDGRLSGGKQIRGPQSVSDCQRRH
jgi:hypothetical protein